MMSYWMTAYVLVWPALVAVVLSVLVLSFYREWRTARKAGRSMI